jgi:hypothetical protein
VAAKLKSESRRTGRSFKETVNELLRLGLTLRGGRATAKPFKVKPQPMGLRPGLSYDNVGELLERLEGPLHR